MEHEKSKAADGHRFAGVSRRAFLTGAAALTAGAAASAALIGANSAWAAPSYSPVPKLPNEISRTDTQTSKAGNPYEVIDVSISGDRTRIIVPHSAVPYSKKWVPAIWFYHANHSSYSSLTTAFYTASLAAVDLGMISIAPNHGGASTYVSPAAVIAHKNAIDYVNAIWRIFYNFGRANSGGGALMCWAFGNGMHQRQHGVYLASAAYDMEALYASDTAAGSPDQVGAAYGNRIDLIRATNPANLSQSAWTGLRIRASYSTTDLLVPPKQHALALIAKAKPVAVETSTLVHGDGGQPSGHYVDPKVNPDMIATFRRWANLG